MGACKVDRDMYQKLACSGVELFFCCSLVVVAYILFGLSLSLNACTKIGLGCPVICGWPRPSAALTCAAPGHPADAAQSAAAAPRARPRPRRQTLPILLILGLGERGARRQEAAGAGRGGGGARPRAVCVRAAELAGGGGCPPAEVTQPRQPPAPRQLLRGRGQPRPRPGEHLEQGAGGEL